MTDDAQKKALASDDDQQAKITEPKQITPASGGAAHREKEAEPISGSAGAAELDAPAEKKLSPEVIEYIKKQEESIKLPEALKEIGVSAGADEDFPAVGPTLPISDTKIVEGLQKPVNNSMRWLAELALFILKQAHYTVKVINGHIRRIIYTGKS